MVANVYRACAYPFVPFTITCMDPVVAVVSSRGKVADAQPSVPLLLLSEGAPSSFEPNPTSVIRSSRYHPLPIESRLDGPNCCVSDKRSD